MADAATAVRKLQSGQPLTDAEKKLLGISITPAKKTLTQEEIDAATAATVAAGGKSTDPANRLPGETASQANARITQGYKDQAKPDLTKEGEAAGATIEFVRTGAGGVGTYKEVFPIGAPIPGERTTSSGNVYDAQGNLISGTGLKTATGGAKTPAQIEAERLQKIADEALAKSNASQAALKKLQDIQAKLARGETLTAEEYALIGVTPKGGTPPPTPTTTGGGTPTPTPTTTGTTTPVPTGTTTAAPALRYTATDGTVFTDQAAYVAYQKMLTDKKSSEAALSAAGAAERQSAYDLLYAEFSAYGLGSLVEPLRGLIQSGASPAEFSIKLRESEPYKKRFSANAQRISKGLKAINEATYLGLEDQYQNILRNAGLPESYWKRGDLGVQESFTNFIANDVSAVELEDRVSTAQQRLIYANPEVSIALKNFYPDISNGDLLAYALDPTKGLEQIKRRITAAEIGSSAVQLGLATNVTDAEYLARYGVTKAQAQQGYRTAAEILPTASKLSDIYARQGLGAYTQQTAEQEIFNVPGAAEAAAKRRKLTELETASFSGRAGMGALARDRAGAF